MAAKRSRRRLGTVLAGLFTSVAVPFLVPLLTQVVHYWADARQQRPPVAPQFAAIPVPDEQVIIVRGEGRTPEEAWADALRCATRQVATTLTDPNPRSIGAATAVGDGAPIIGCKDLGCTRDGLLWHRAVAVSIDRAAQLRRSKAAGYP